MDDRSPGHLIQKQAIITTAVRLGFPGLLHVSGHGLDCSSAWWTLGSHSDAVLALMSGLLGCECELLMQPNTWTLVQMIIVDILALAGYGVSEE